MIEDEVINALELHFQRRGYTIIGKCVGNKAGVDLVVQVSPGELLFVEAKGIRPTVIRTRLACQLAWDSAYARLPQMAAGTKRIRRYTHDNNLVLDDEPTTPRHVGIAVPDLPDFRAHASLFSDRLRAAGDWLFFVHQNGDVHQELPN